MKKCGCNVDETGVSAFAHLLGRVERCVTEMANGEKERV